MAYWRIYTDQIEDANLDTMSYKLDYKTICSGYNRINQERTEGIKGRFFIPAYQRGYRWTPKDVTRLLDDILESQGQPYSLQPIVVKPAPDCSNVWELIDGQQRLTTLWLILRFMNKGETAYTLEYETRKGSQKYLQTLDASEAGSNIDYFHLYEASQAIAKWFDKKYGSDAKQILIDDVFSYLSKSVRVIWYQAPANVESIPLFTRLNRGRIPLSDAELVKATLLTEVAKKLQGREIEVAAQWDGIERDLQRAEIWAFVANAQASDAEQHATRIGVLLDTLADQANPFRGKNRPRYHTFDSLRGEVQADPLAFWENVQTLHAQILGWFETPEQYNKIGYLVTTGTPFGTIQTWAKARNKKVFDALLTNEIKNSLKIKAEDLEDTLRYDNHGYEKLSQLLLLFNVVSTQDRFPYEKHVGHCWSLEHIHAQNSQNLNRAEQWETSLLLHRSALITLNATQGEKAGVSDLIADIDKALPDVKTDRFGDRFKDLIERIQAVLNPDWAQGEADHTIANLALLSRDDNSALNNAVFEVKRQKVLSWDRSGNYIPLATRNVFLKYYSETGALQPHFWSEDDRKSYREAIKKKLKDYLN